MSNRFHQITIICLSLLLLCSCARSYSGQYFSFLPGTKPHENDWTYLCKIIAWDPFGKRPIEKGKRKIEIIINDKKSNNVLKGTFELESASIGSKIQWGEFEQLTLDLYERSNQFVDDDYNRQLITAGPRHLLTLKYVWDGKKYIKSITEPAS